MTRCHSVDCEDSVEVAVFFPLLLWVRWWWSSSFGPICFLSAGSALSTPLRRCWPWGEIDPQSSLLHGDDVRVSYPSCCSWLVHLIWVLLVVPRWIRVCYHSSVMVVLTVFLACYYDLFVPWWVYIPDVFLAILMVCFCIFMIWSMMLSWAPRGMYLNAVMLYLLTESLYNHVEARQGMMIWVCVTLLYACRWIPLWAMRWCVGKQLPWL
jgi:hypothetical protein